MLGENFAYRQHLKFCHFQLVHCASKNPTPPKVSNRFSKSSPELEDVEGGHSGGKIEVRRCFNFAMARWKLWASTTFEILPLSTCSLCQQKSHISKSIQPIFEIFASARRLRVCIWVESFRCADILPLQWKGEDFDHRQHLKFCQFQLVHCASKNPMSPLVFNRFSKSLPRLEDI